MSTPSQLLPGLTTFNKVSDRFGSGMPDPYPFFAERRRSAPVMRGDVMLELGGPSFAGLHDGPAFTLLRYEDVAAALRNTDTFSSRIWAEVMGPLMGTTILAMDAQEHRFWRGLVMPFFSPRALVEWDEKTLRPIAQQLVGELAIDKRLDLFEFAFHLPVRAVYAILGLSDDPESYDEWTSLAMSMLLALAIDPSPEKAQETQEYLSAAMRASGVMLEKLLSYVERKRAAGARGNDLICRLINAEFEHRKLSDLEIANFVRSLLPPATETTTRQFLNIASCVFTRPDLLDQLKRDRSLIRAAVMEGERYESTTLVIPRETTRDIKVRGVEIPKGAGVMLAVASANRDEETFSRADEFVLGRTGPTALAFGTGPHVCVGQNAARLEMVAMFNTVLDLPGVRLDPDLGPPTIRGVNLRSPEALGVVWE